MATNWKDASEIVMGLILKNELSENAVRPDILYPPYDGVMRAIKRGNWTIESLIEICGVGPISAALESINHLNGTRTSVDWIRVLEMSNATYVAGSELEQIAKKLMKNDNVDLSKLHVIAQKAQAGEGKLTSAASVVAREVPFILSGYAPLDREMGGIPEVGLITVGGATKSGKTSWIIRVIFDFLKQHPDKYICFFSIEMLKEELKMRMKEVEPNCERVDEETGEIIQDERLSRILIQDGPTTPEQIASIASQVDNLGAVVIDFADLMIQGEASESKYASMYVTLMLAAKSLHCPIFLLAQFNRQYTGNLPRPNFLRYTGLAEALSWMLITLWNPEISYHVGDDDDEDMELPILEGHAYIIVWLCRGGFRLHPNDSPGAIAVPFNGRRGWHPNRGSWYSLRKDGSKRRTKVKPMY